MSEQICYSIGELASAEIWILGAGISGLTTAIVMQALGFRTAILARRQAQQKNMGGEDPRVATDYAMASAYPHNLRIRGLEQISDDSQIIFRHLHELENAGIDVQRIYEVFEFQPPENAAPLSQKRMCFETFSGTPQALKQNHSLTPPHRPEAEYLWGWSFESYFADMPIYLAYLWSRFAENGGKFFQTEIDLEEISSTVSGKILVNCLGAGAIDIFPDGAPLSIVRGRQLMVPNRKPIRDSDGLALAYNYTPRSEVFARADGNAEYLHFFARSDGWILGQTREPGQLDSNGNWVGAAVRAEEFLIGKQAIAKPILTLNQSILRNWKGCSFDESSLIAREGYRYYRDPDASGVRLEKCNLAEYILVHNYGHGGSGITMSWGAALECGRMILADLDKGKIATPGTGMEALIHSRIFSSS